MPILNFLQIFRYSFFTVPLNCISSVVAVLAANYHGRESTERKFESFKIIWFKKKRIKHVTEDQNLTIYWPADTGL